MADVNVLLTCAGQRVDIVRAFREVLAEGTHRGRVLVSDLDPLSPALFAADEVVELPPVDDPGYGAAVAAVCRREGVRVVLPLTDLDPVVLAHAAAEILEAGAQTLVPRPEIALGCQDKWACHLMLEERGLPSPPTWLPDEVDAATLPYPVLLKPRMGFAGRHIHRCANPAELAFFRDYSPAESVVQQALPGLEFSIDCLGGPDGAALGAIPRSMIQSKGGEQIKGETLDDPQLVELGAATVEALGLIGPSTVQCFREDGRILGHHRHQHPLRRRLSAPAGRGGRLPADDRGDRGGRARRRAARVAHAGRRDDPLPGPDDAPENTVGARPPPPRGLGSAVVDREITLRDYGRVLWSGRWLILATTVVAAIAGLILSIASTTTYTARAELFVGQATTVSGTPVATPATNPGTVTAALGGDAIVVPVAKELGITPARVRRDVTLSAPKAPGGSIGNQPTIVTITFKDESKEIARKGANSYAQIVYERAQQGFSSITDSYEKAVATASASVADLEASLARYRRQLAATNDPQEQIILESLLNSTGQQLDIASHGALGPAAEPGQGGAVPALDHLAGLEPVARRGASPTGRGRSSSRRCSASSSASSSPSSGAAARRDVRGASRGTAAALVLALGLLVAGCGGGGDGGDTTRPETAPAGTVAGDRRRRRHARAGRGRQRRRHALGPGRGDGDVGRGRARRGAPRHPLRHRPGGRLLGRRGGHRRCGPGAGGGLRPRPPEPRVRRRPDARPLRAGRGGAAAGGIARVELREPHA